MALQNMRRKPICRNSCAAALLVACASAAQAGKVEPPVIEPFRGRRSKLLPLFTQADDSRTAIDGYIGLGELLVARRGRRIVGYVQLVSIGADQEIKSIAVVARERRRGIGTALLRAAMDQAFAAGAGRVLIATSTADIDNLRLYLRLGFRMDRVERDAFTAELGYPPLEAGIPLRDRVWLSITSGEWR
jgi:ribosomal protein S18 acetylase RimI-like enzyme